MHLEKELLLGNSERTSDKPRGLNDTDSSQATDLKLDVDTVFGDEVLLFIKITAAVSRFGIQKQIE